MKGGIEITLERHEIELDQVLPHKLLKTHQYVLEQKITKDRGVITYAVVYIGDLVELRQAGVIE